MTPPSLGPSSDDIAVDDRHLDQLALPENANTDDLTEWVRAVDPLLDSVSVTRTVERLRRRSGGLGPVEEFLADPTIGEIMINGPGPVWLDRGTGSEETDVLVESNDIELLIEHILDPLGLRVDRISPLADARLADGSRVNIVIPPLAVDGPIVTVRRFATKPLPLDRFGPPEVVSLLTELTRRRATTLVVGGTAAGKTTLLNALGALIDPDERIVTIEDTAELQLPGRHVVRLEARPPNSEGVGEVTIRHLVRNALRMRPDRLVIGEVRGPEALDLVLALNTGHRGSLATTHASDPNGALRRLELLALLGGADLPIGAVREQLRGAVDVIVQVAKLGRHRCIVEVARPSTGPSGVETIWAHDRGAPR